MRCGWLFFFSLVGLLLPAWFSWRWAEGFFLGWSWWCMVFRESLFDAGVPTMPTYWLWWNCYYFKLELGQVGPGACKYSLGIMAFGNSFREMRFIRYRIAAVQNWILRLIIQKKLFQIRIYHDSTSTYLFLHPLSTIYTINVNKSHIFRQLY